MKESYPAHIRRNEEGTAIQTVGEHCRGTATYAARDLREIGLRDTAALAGLLHDMGKSKEEYSNYLIDAVMNERSVKRGSVNHTFAGCRFLLEQYHKSSSIGYEELTSEVLAFAIGAHHGLFDCVNEKKESGFLHRLTRQGIHYQEALHNYFVESLDPEEVDRLFHASVSELIPIYVKLGGMAQKNKNLSDLDSADNIYSETCFYVGLLARLILSATIDGDRQDTAEFMENAKYPPPLEGEKRRKIWQDCLSFMEEKLGEFPQNTPIQRARQNISNQCAAFAEREQGIYRLNVPTGGGKTLSSLRFALAHAAKYNKSRIILTSSLLSILDQNVQIIRKFVPDPHLILEHHSNVIRHGSNEEQVAWEQMCAQWPSSKIIVTTLVQLLNACFSGETSCIRRFQALCNSVIVIDEVQTVPGNLLTLFNLSLNFLSEICGATIILCSATQPSLEAVPHPLMYLPEDMVPYNEEIWSVFQRTQIQNAGIFTLDEIPAFAKKILGTADSLLIICNKKSEAETLFQKISGPEINCFHLSAAMCMAHRRAVLRQMQEALDMLQKKVVCVSTQVIEAGVDISFQRVIRLAAGMDSVVQAAGRCNRNGEEGDLAPVYIVQCAGEKLSGLEDIRRGQNATISLLARYEAAPGEFRFDLSSNEAIRFYYERLYRSMDRHYQDKVIPERECTVYDLMSANEKYADGNFSEAGRFFLQQAFKAAGDAFHVFDQNTQDVLAPYGDGKQLRTQLIAISEGPRPWDYKEIHRLLDQTKPFTVALFQYQLDRLNAEDAILPLFDGKVLALTDGFYNQNTGFSLKQGLSDFWEV